jgi:hypothetical protein
MPLLRTQIRGQRHGLREITLFYTKVRFFHLLLLL